MTTFRDAVVPVLSAYLLLAGVVLHAAAHPDAGRVRQDPVPTGPRLKLIALTVGGGYGVFLVIVQVFHVWLVGDRGAMHSALRGGTFLAVVAAATFAVLSGIRSRRAG